MLIDFELLDEEFPFDLVGSDINTNRTRRAVLAIDQPAINYIKLPQHRKNPLFFVSNPIRTVVIQNPKSNF